MTSLLNHADDSDDAMDIRSIEECMIDAIEEDDIIDRLSGGDMDAARDLRVVSDEIDTNWRDYKGPDDHDLEALASLVEAITHEVESLMRDGLYAEAARRVRLITEPKWQRIRDCDAAYGAATGRVYGPPDQRSPLARLHAELSDLPMFVPAPAPSCEVCPHASPVR